MKRVGIICGGFSSEFEISVLSAMNIHTNFPKEFRSYLVFLRKSGWTAKIGEEEVPVDLRDLSFEENGTRIKLDAVIVYVHGDPGENGKVQAYLEMIDMPYINSSPLASEISFDKWFCNQFLRGFGINVAKSLHLTKLSDLPDSGEVIEEFGLPLFVKPCDSGSSYGIARVNEEKELQQAVANAFAEGKSVVIEAFLDGREVTCGVYRSADGIQALPLCEIISENEFFDYEAKYLGKSKEIVPARISDEATAEIQELSKRIYQLLNLRSIGRVDYMLVGDVPYVIEVNTTPGFSGESIVPKMIRGANMSITDFWRQILEVEME